MKLKKVIAIALGAVITAGMMAGCAKKDENTGKIDPALFENGVTVADGDQIAIMDITGFGKVYIALYPESTPKTVENFVGLAQKGYYDDLTFHRVIDNFMIQGGDPSGTGTSGSSIWDEPFEDEFTDKMRNFTGALSMANSGPNTNGSQFFIINAPPNANPNEPLTAEYIKQCQEAAQINGFETSYSESDIKKYLEIGGVPHLDGAQGYHTPFGQVFYGMEIIKKIMAVEVDPTNSKPAKAVKIKDINITTY